LKKKKAPIRKKKHAKTKMVAAHTLEDGLQSETALGKKASQKKGTENEKKREGKKEKQRCLKATAR